MNREKDILEFIERLKCKEFQDYRDKFIKQKNYDQNKWSRKNPKLHQECVKKYDKTDEGKYASSKKNATRRGKFKQACMDLGWDEKKLIGRFYKNCPQGYEVDHIVPISKGGKHCLSNLQYLTKEENRRKSNKLDYK